MVLHRSASPGRDLCVSRLSSVVQVVHLAEFFTRPRGERFHLNRAAHRGQMLDRIADVQFAAEEIRDLAEHAGLRDDDFAAIDRVMQLLYDETDALLRRFED